MLAMSLLLCFYSYVLSIKSCYLLEFTCSNYCSGNHERDVPGTGSFYDSNDSGGECGVLAETMFYVPAENRAKFW